MMEGGSYVGLILGRRKLRIFSYVAFSGGPYPETMQGLGYRAKTLYTVKC